MKINSLLVLVSLVFLIIVICFWLYLNRTTDSVVNHPFQKVKHFFNSSFKTDVSASDIQKAYVYGPSFLSATGTIYTVETIEFQPNERLQFAASFSQIGSEYNVFTVQRIDSDHTRIAIQQRVSFIFPIPFNRKWEEKILSNVITELNEWGSRKESRSQVHQE